MRVVVRLAVLGLLTSASWGCALLHARTPEPGPSLATPPAPAHVVPPPAPPPEPPPEASDRSPAEPTPAPSGRPTSGPPARAADPAAAAPEAPPAVVPTPTSTPTLQTTPDVDATVQRVRAVIEQASRDLRRVNEARLGADGRAQYDTAQRFLQQAEGALVERNVAYAEQLADKAAALAAVLPKG